MSPRHRYRADIGTKRHDGGPATAIEGFADLERIGSGGYSVVYRAREIALHRDVAIKVLNSGLESEAEQRAFERECRALGQLTSHPNIVTVYHAAFTTDMRPCIVMERYQGNFRERLERSGPLPIDQLLSVGVRIAGALQTAHDAGVLHRDIKPHNIFLSAYGEPALGDFGISTVDDERSHGGPTGLSVAYAAPELLEDATASPQSDLYGLGATLYHLAAGSAPFASPDLRTSIHRIVSEPPPELDRPDAPAGLDRILRSCMAKDPADRPRSAMALAEMLREVQAGAGLPQTTVPAARADVATPSPPVTLSARTALPPPPPPVESAPSSRRAWIAAGVAVAAIAVIVVGVLALGGGDDAADTPTTAPTIAPPDTFYDALVAPTGVAVSAVGDGTFSVAASPVDGATSYEIEVVGASSDPVTAAVLPATVDGAGATTLCVTVRAVGESGRVSRDSEPACS